MRVIVYDARGNPKSNDPLVYPVGHSGFVQTGGAIIDGFSNYNNHLAHGTTALSANTLYAMPFHAPHRYLPRLDRLAVEQTASTPNIRIGLYRNKKMESIYPGSLIVDSGSFAASAGLGCSFVPFQNQVLVPGEIYWIALVADGAITVRTMPVGGVSCFLGVAKAGSTTPNTGVTVAFTFAALPDPFPASATFMVTAVPDMRFTFCR